MRPFNLKDETCPRGPATVRTGAAVRGRDHLSGVFFERGEKMDEAKKEKTSKGNDSMELVRDVLGKLCFPSADDRRLGGVARAHKKYNRNVNQRHMGGGRVKSLEPVRI